MRRKGDRQGSFEYHATRAIYGVWFNAFSDTMAAPEQIKLTHSGGASLWVLPRLISTLRSWTRPGPGKWWWSRRRLEIKFSWVLLFVIELILKFKHPPLNNVRNSTNLMSCATSSTPSEVYNIFVSSSVFLTFNLNHISHFVHNICQTLNEIRSVSNSHCPFPQRLCLKDEPGHTLHPHPKVCGLAVNKAQSDESGRKGLPLRPPPFR